MPRAGETKHKAAAIEKAVKANLEDDVSVAKIAKDMKVTRQTVYTWIADYKAKVMERHKRASTTTAEREATTKAELIAELQTLRLENRQLRDKVIDLLMKAGTA